MARQPRRLAAGGLYRVWASAQPQLMLFRDREDCTVYLQALTSVKRRTHLKLYHYCLLPNEVHLIVGLPRIQALSATLHQVHVLFRWHHRRKYRIPGRLWHDRFRHQTVMPQELLRIGHQVESTPVQAELTAHPADYPYSSYVHYAFGQPNPYLDANPHYLALATAAYRRQEGYRKLTEPMSARGQAFQKARIG